MDNISIVNVCNRLIPALKCTSTLIFIQVSLDFLDYFQIFNQPVIDAFKKYKSYFFNPEIQQNIRESKEEQFQEGFLRELFVNIFDFKHLRLNIEWLVTN